MLHVLNFTCCKLKQKLLCSCCLTCRCCLTTVLVCDCFHVWHWALEPSLANKVEDLKRCLGFYQSNYEHSDDLALFGTVSCHLLPAIAAIFSTLQAFQKSRCHWLDRFHASHVISKIACSILLNAIVSPPCFLRHSQTF